MSVNSSKTTFTKCFLYKIIYLFIEKITIRTPAKYLRNLNNVKNFNVTKN